MKIRFAIIVLSALLMLGCISQGDDMDQGGDGNAIPPEQNTSQPAINDTNQTEPPKPQEKLWERYNSGIFSFEYPVGMVPNVAVGKFMGATTSSGIITERMAVSSLNTLQAYGKNKNDIFKVNPSKTASDFLLQDAEYDPLGIIDDAESMGELSTSTIDRDVYLAQAPFKLSSGNITYTGYALSMFIPEHSLHIRARILAIDPDRAEDIRNNFILSFRLE